MSTSRRKILAAAGAGLAAFKIASETAYAAPNPDHEPDVAALIKRSALLHEGGVADGRDMVGFNHHNQNTP